MRNAKLAFWVSLTVVILLASLLRAWLLNSFLLSSDEGIHLVWLRLLAAGYQPYSEVYITYPPLYPMSIYAIWSLWPAESAQRWFSVGFTIFGAVGIALIARQLIDSIAGLAAATLTWYDAISHTTSAVGLDDIDQMGYHLTNPTQRNR